MNFPLPELYSTLSEPVDLKPAAPEGLAEALALSIILGPGRHLGLAQPSKCERVSAL